MFDPCTPRIFALPPGADFPVLLAQGLRSRMQGQSPEDMARVEVLVNTARMQARLREAFVRQGAGFLPRIRLIADLAGVGEAAPLHTRLELARLIRGLLQAEPDLGPPSAAFALADSLFALLDEMQGEGVAPEVLERLDVSQHSQHWERSLRFIRLIARFLGPQGGGQARLRAAVLALAEDWRTAPPAHPLIVAGSTGSRGPTALLMQAVARLPQGALVLPGFDPDLPPADDALSGEDHPQFRYARLLAALDLPAGAVRPWVDTPPPDPARNALVSLALRPAPVTDQWLRDGPMLGDLGAATKGLSLIEAPDPRTEALAIALCLRQAVVDGRRAALVTPDRTLARRVTAALDRWHLRPDDSAGRPLALSAPGRLLRQSAAQLVHGISAEALIALLKHPLVHSAGARGPHLRHVRDLELHLRTEAIPFPDAAAITHWATGATDRADWARWLHPLTALEADHDIRPLPDWLAAHLALIETLATGTDGRDTGELWRLSAGEAARAAMDDLLAQAGHGGDLTGHDYLALLDSLFSGREVREVQQVHPDVMIWGTLEARAQGADLVILGGLNEGTWPAAPGPDPWFNRQMRHDAGLLLPERQIGLSAHDFQQAVGAPQVVLARARRNGEAETVPSRWLNRLQNLIAGLTAQGGDHALAAMRARGQHWLTLAGAFEADVSGVPQASARRNPRPAPAPPIEARLSRLSVTRVETLVRDPFAIYAARILKLDPLLPLSPQPDARVRGTAMHRVADLYVRQHPPGTPGSVDALLAIAAEVLVQDCPWHAVRAHWLARLSRVAPEFVAWNAAQPGTPALTEVKGAMTFGDPPFTLTGQPDRIDRDADGRLTLFDYKTGSVPSKLQIEHFNKQLILLAIMATEDSFGLGPAEVAGAQFIGLGSTFDHRAAEVDTATLARHRAELEALIATYRNPDQGFTAHRAIEREDVWHDYDTLARRGEWAPGDPAVTLPVGLADG